MFATAERFVPPTIFSILDASLPFPVYVLHDSGGVREKRFTYHGSKNQCFVSESRKFVREMFETDRTTLPVDKVALAIVLTEKAVSHLKRLKGDKDSLYLRVGVRQGGCSGMPYVMDFEDESKVRADDSKIEADGITLTGR